MIHVVPHTRTALYEDQFRQMDQLLQRTHQQELQRTNSSSEPLPPADQSTFADQDTPLAIYLMRLLENGTLTGSVKLNPSEFRVKAKANSADAPLQTLPAGANIWDVSHFCLRKMPEQKRILSDMMLGILEFSLTWGIEQLNFLIDEDLLPALQLLPLPISFIYTPVEVRGAPFLPAMLHVNPETLQAMRALTKRSSPMLRMSDPGAGPPTLPPEPPEPAD